jgi:hypothetical protein
MPQREGLSAPIRYASRVSGPVNSSGQNRRWRSGPSQVGDPSSVAGHLQPTTEPKISAKRALAGISARRCVTGPPFVGRGTRRWGPALAAVLVVLVLGIEGSALGQPQAPQAYRLKVDASRTTSRERQRSECRSGRASSAVDPEADPARNQAARARATARDSPPMSATRSRVASSTSGSRRRPRLATGAGAPSPSPSTASRAAVGGVRYTVHP